MTALGALVTTALSGGQIGRSLPEISYPIMFDTAEADTILAALQVFPADNPWNQDVSLMPVQVDSARIIASIGASKPLDYNLDMNFIIVPRDQIRVPVK